MYLARLKWLSTLVLFVTFSCFAVRVGDKAALVIIDMQAPFAERSGYHTTDSNKKKIEQIIAKQLDLIEKAKKKKIPIVFIEYENYGPSNEKLRNAVSSYKDVKTFVKSTDGMFNPYNKNVKQLEEFLESKKIGHLIITGANGGACVISSIQGALNNQYDVVSITTAVADFNYADFIYPYKYNSTPYHSCPNNCTFEEVDDFGFESPVKKAKPKSIAVDDSDRSVAREEVSDSESKKVQQPNGATAQ